MTLTSLLLAVGIISIAKDGIAQIMNREFDWAMLSPMQIGIIATAAIGVVLASTAYPAWIATKTAPVLAIRNLQAGNERWSIRRVATVAQFTMAIALLACAVIFYQQMRYLKDKSLGFEMDGLTTIDINSGALRSQFQAIKQEFSKLPEVQAVSVSSRVPGEWKDYAISNARKQGTEQLKDLIFIGADEDFLETFDIKMTAGSNFTSNPADSSTALLNELAVKALGLEDPIGQWIEIPTVNWSGDIENFEPTVRLRVIGVVADFHFEDIRQQIRPMIIGNWKNPIQNIDYYTLKINTKDMSKTIASLKAVNDKFDSENPIELHFLDEQFQRFYEADTRRSWMLMLFSGVVILIACLGLFSITAFAIRQRTKEIGIRKVLGASVKQIVTLISKDFMLLVGLSVVLALPLAWWAMSQWLEDFAYRIDIQWWMLALAAVGAVLIALLTVSTQAIKAAFANPVDSIKTE
ncbi:MAG: FtsX-like permease family protein [Saprospiraceae bacterium]|nr:FtsX-like permease family protein [Saprospiraceae bacterium]